MDFDSSFSNSMSVVLNAENRIRSVKASRNVEGMKDRTRRGYNRYIDGHRPQLLNEGKKDKEKRR
eukprot:CAMPEP_0118659388 /NCGR_PEP_ID=MMETSP0785-20121206/15082_1 /TAXON_ID=91992 /ORGANISM="Bolidomonas pacifica, Strain CCMP 1866" /LENGTH=64 /DNA_ID=CAMNT_0006552483 /DNA_START=222 /DNA_END=413 /DNA_ORIENTATION=+